MDTWGGWSLFRWWYTVNIADYTFQWCAILCFALKVVTRIRILISLCQLYIYIYSRYYSAFWNFTSGKLFLTTLFFVYLYYHCTNISSLRIINLLLISYLKIRRFKLKKNLSIRITLGTKIKVSSIFSNFPFAYSKFKNWNWSWRNFT